MDFDKDCKSYYFLEKLAKVWEVEAKVFYKDKRIVLKNVLSFALYNRVTLIWSLIVYEVALWTFYHLSLTPVLCSRCHHSYFTKEKKKAQRL